MDVAVFLVPLLIMGTATLCGLSLLAWLVRMERHPNRCQETAVAAKPNRRRLRPIGCRPAAQASVPRQAVPPTSRRRHAPQCGSARA